MPDIGVVADKPYDAALDPDAWLAALQDLACSFGGLGVSVIDIDGPPRIVEVSSGLEDLLDLYRTRWAERDPCVAYGVQHHLRPGIICTHDYMSDEFRARSDYCQEFLRPQGVCDILHLVVSPFAGSLRSLNIQRLISEGPAIPEIRSSFAEMARHISRASAIRMRLQRADAFQAGLADGLSDFDCAVAVVDHRGRLLLANAAFDGLSTEGLRVRGGFIRIDSHAMQQRLDRLIDDAFGEDRGAFQPDTLAIARPAVGCLSSSEPCR